MSTLIEEVDKKNILRKVMSIVSQAHNEVLATMDINEEIRNPQEEYFILLKKMIEKGVIMKRLAFGKKINFKKFNNEHNIKNENYHCILSNTQNYKRMILVDRKNLFFATEAEGKRRFFFTKDAKYIKEFTRYFLTEFRKSKNITKEQAFC